MDIKMLQAILADFNEEEFGIESILDQHAKVRNRYGSDFYFGGFIKGGIRLWEKDYDGYFNEDFISWEEIEEYRVVAEQEARKKIEDDVLRAQLRELISIEEARVSELRLKAYAEQDVVWRKIAKLKEGMKYETNQRFWQIQLDAQIRQDEAMKVEMAKRFDLKNTFHKGNDIAKLQAFYERLKEIR